ncbi:MAG: peptidylprolyl isomerase [Ktedonobacteraceae bacterium]|nr:peptidylprolyl isomerase [Ktedonobacteraceae bacterium]
MPKTTKRAAAKRAARIARAHSTELPKPVTKRAAPLRRPPGYKPPARGIARYPWATFLTLSIIVLGVYGLYFYHLGPFAPPVKAKPKPRPVAASPCLKMVSQLTDSKPAPTAAESKKIVRSYKTAPAMSINAKKVYCAGISTNKGLIVLELDPQDAPQTVNNFVYLAQHQFYDGLTFHRVVAKFIIQSGDPLGTGTGGPGYKIPAETVKSEYTPGCLAMAKQGNEAVNSGSQFFICTADDTKSLQKVYNLFGHVVKGMDVVLKIQGPGDDPATKNIKPDVINHIVVAVAP